MIKTDLRCTLVLVGFCVNQLIMILYFIKFINLRLMTNLNVNNPVISEVFIKYMETLKEKNQQSFNRVGRTLSTLYTETVRFQILFRINIDKNVQS